MLCGCESQGPFGPKGEPCIPGEKGEGVLSITKVEKTSSEGNTETYTT